MPVQSSLCSKSKMAIALALVLSTAACGSDYRGTPNNQSTNNAAPNNASTNGSSTNGGDDYLAVYDEYAAPFGDTGTTRYLVRNLNIEGQGNKLTLESGGSVSMELEVYPVCERCGTAINQVIVGTGGEERAQACIVSYISDGSGDWQTTQFSLRIPDAEGVYYVKTRAAAAFSCDGALDWWLIDRPDGPGDETIIGYVEIR